MRLNAQVQNASFVSRGGEKLAAAFDTFGIDVRERICADLGSHVGGFVDCLLQRGATRVYSIDTSYGTLAWKLRRDPRVVVMERTNAIHAVLPELVDLVSIDVGWTPQRKVLPNVRPMLLPEGQVLSLIKPHYESSRTQSHVLTEEESGRVLTRVLQDIERASFRVLAVIESPLRGHGGNVEFLAHLMAGSQSPGTGKVE